MPVTKPLGPIPKLKALQNAIVHSSLNAALSLSDIPTTDLLRNPIPIKSPLIYWSCDSDLDALTAKDALPTRIII